MPKKISEAIIHKEKEVPKFIPKRYKQHVMIFKKEVNDNSIKVMDYLESKQVTFEDLLHLIDEVKLQDLQKLINNVDSTHLKSPDSLYNYIVMHFDFKGIPTETFKEDFIEHIDEKKINKAFQFYKNNEEQLPIMFPVAKETIKKLVIKKRNEIEQKLKGTDTTSIEAVME